MIALISILSIFAIFIGWGFYEVLSYEIDECKHTNFAHYHSRKISQCIDCGFEKPLESHL